MKNRRDFIKNATLGSVATLTLSESVLAHQHGRHHEQGSQGNGTLTIKGYLLGQRFEPFQSVQVSSTTAGIIRVYDAKGTEYASSKTKTTSFTFQVAGALGVHQIVLTNGDARIDTILIDVNTKTSIVDKKGTFNELLTIVQWSLVGEWGETSSFRLDGRIYTVFVAWLRDHTHTMKMMKYFHPKLKDGFDLYANYQREDGLIWDNLYSRSPEPGWWDSVLSKERGNFIKVVENGQLEFKRQPVEADMEYLFVECLYFTWKATGDTAWMSKGIDKAVKALNYACTDPYRWSTKYNLVKRGFTIDTWDFVHDYDLEKTGYGSGQCINLQTNDFGIMHGDNTGMYAACNQMYEMMQALGRTSDANFWKQKGDELKKNLDKIAWNGTFYTHYVPEKEDFWQRHDIGKTDPSKQISLSNAYALNRGVTHEQAVNIIKTYLSLRDNLPSGSPGEWYTIYPIFENGFGKDNGYYEYMNGGVITIVAGELAHGAFEHGFESYGADVLQRVAKLGKSHNGYLPCTFKGAKLTPPTARFTPIALDAVANADFSSQGAPGVPGWSGEGPENDLKNMPVGKQVFRDIPFQITDPATNGRKGALIISNSKNYASKATLKVGKKAKTIYLLHARSRQSMIGYATLNYADGTSFTDYMLDGKIDNWWYPSDAAQWKVAFGVPNGKSLRVGMGIYGLANPNPDIEITSISFELLKDNKEKWFIGAITLSDQEPYFNPGDVSFGIPDRWGAAAVGYGLIEGLAGVKDLGLAFDKALIAPRWEAANETEATVTIKYEASGAYVSYSYLRTSSSLEMQITGSGTSAHIEVLLPADKKAGTLKINGVTQNYSLKKVENSSYLVCSLSLLGIQNFSLTFA